MHVCYVASVMSNSLQTHRLVHQVSISMRFPRQEYWNGLPFLFPGDLPNPGIEPMSPAWQADSLPLSHLGSPLKVSRIIQMVSFCVWLISLSIISLRFIHIVAYIRMLFHFNGWIIFHCMYILHWFYPFICQWTFVLVPPFEFVLMAV